MEFNQFSVHGKDSSFSFGVHHYDKQVFHGQFIRYTCQIKCLLLSKYVCCYARFVSLLYYFISEKGKLLSR